MSDHLPSGWTTATLGDLADYINGAAFKPEDWGADGTPIIRIQNLTNPAKPLNRTRRNLDQRFLIRRGDLLFSWSATLDAFIWDREAAWLNQHIFKVVPHSNLVDPTYLYFLLRSEVKTLIASEHLHGSTMRHINRGPFLAHQIRLPPLPEQHRIVARIEALFARTRRARADLERIAPLAKRHEAATLAKAFSGDLLPVEQNRERQNQTSQEPASTGPYELPPDWRWEALPTLGRLGRGKSRHRPRNDPALYGGPYPFVQTGDVRSAQGRLTQASQSYSEFGLSQSRLWPRETLCITIAANIAETAILDIPACFPDSVVGFIANPERCLPEYVERFIRTAKSDLAAFAPATAQKNINLEILEQVLVPLAPIAEQRNLVRAIEKAEYATRIAAAQAVRALTLLDRLEQSILTRAFRGELVEQDPNDEPARVELEKLRHALATAGRGRPRKKTMPATDALVAPRKKGPAVPKNRTDADVKGQPYLANHLRQIGSAATTEDLYKAADLSIADFYKQLSEEVAKGWVKDASGKLEAA